MNKNITFLRNECSSKNEKIKFLLNDKTTNTKTSNYIYPKRVSKPPNYNNQFDIATQNINEGLTQDDGKDVEETNGINEKKKRKPSDRYNKDNKNKRFKNKQMNPENQQQKRPITILGDSIIKGIKSHKIKKQLGTGENIFVKSFPGAETSCMHDYVKPSLKFKSDLFILWYK